MRAARSSGRGKAKVEATKAWVAEVDGSSVMRDGHWISPRVRRWGDK